MFQVFFFVFVYEGYSALIDAVKLCIFPIRHLHIYCIYLDIFCILKKDQPFSGILLIALSEMAVMERDGLTPGLAEIMAPSHTSIFS